MNNTEIAGSILEKVPPIVYVVLFVVFALVWIADRNGYILRKKNGKVDTNGAQALATELVKQLAEQSQKPDANGDTKFIPGFSPTCVEHSGDIREIKTEMPHITKGIEDLNEKVDLNLNTVKDMFGEIKEKMAE